MMKKIGTICLAVCLTLALLTGCGGGKNPGTSPSPTATVYNDEAATTDFVAKVGTETIWCSDFQYFFTTALTEINFDEANIPDDATDQEQYQLMIAYLNQEKEAGLTRLQWVIDRTMELCVHFKISKILAEKAGFYPAGEDLKEIEDQIDQVADYYLQYGDQYGATTRDEIMRLYAGMNVNDFKRFSAEQEAVSQYAEKRMGELSATDQELEDFYKENVEAYRTVTVRHILFKTTETNEDEESVAMDAAKKAEVKLYAEDIMARIKGHIADIAKYTKGFSEDDATTNSGLFDVTANASFVKEFKDWALKQTAVSDQLEIVETSYGYHIMKCEGITDYYTSTGLVADSSATSVAKVKENVKTDLLSIKFEAEIKALTSDAAYAVTERNDTLIQSTADKTLKSYEPAEAAEG